MCIRISAESIFGEWLPVDVPGWAWCDIMMVLADHVCVTPLGVPERPAVVRIMAVKAAGCPLKSVFSMAKIQTNIKVGGFRLIGNIDLGG